MNKFNERFEKMIQIFMAFGQENVEEQARKRQ